MTTARSAAPKVEVPCGHLYIRANVEPCNSLGKIISYVISSAPAMSDLRKKRNLVSEDAWGPKSQNNSGRVELMGNVNACNVGERDAILFVSTMHKQKVAAVQDLVCKTPDISPKKVNEEKT